MNMKTARYAKTKEAQTYADELQQPEDTYWPSSQDVYDILRGTETSEQVCSSDKASGLY